jgi:hypothetical protein
MSTVAGENEREQDERDDDERDEAPEGDEAQAQGEESVDPNVPRNRAERRAIAKAARRGRTVRVGDEGAVAADGSDGSGDPLIGPNTSIGGDTPKLDDAGPKRPKVPPRTMSKGTGNAEGVPEWALGAGEWFTKNRTNAVTVLLTVVVLGGGLFGWRAYSTAREARATGAYAEALKSTFAIIAAEEPGADDPRRDLPRFRTFEERGRASLEKLRRAEQGNSSARVTPLVRLTEAGTLYQMGRYAEAKQLYLSVIGADLAGLEGRALEGLAFTLESLNDLDGAMVRYRELQNAQDGMYRDQAQFYQARLLVRRNDNARAKDVLRGVVERLGHPAASDPTAAFQGSLREQSLALLRDIDPTDPAVVQADRQREASGPSDSHEHGGPGGDPLRGLPPELREQLQKALRERGNAGGRR